MKYKEAIEFLGDEVISIAGVLPDGYELHFADLEHLNAHTLDWNQKTNELTVKDGATTLVCIKVKDAKRTVTLLGNAFFVKKPTGIHPTAIVENGAKIGKDCYIGPYAIVRSCSTIGDNVRVESGAVIGNDGFGFVRDADGDLIRFPQLGCVDIGDKVEIGANVTIDRGALSNTVIRCDVKINAGVHIAHNVMIGEHTVITANVNVSGSSVIGSNVWIGPGVTVRDHVTIGDNAYIGIGSNVVKDIPANEVWCGNPARKLRERIK